MSLTGLLLPYGEYRVRHTESRLLRGRPHAVTTGQQQPSQDILTAHLRPCLTRALVNTNRLGFARVYTHRKYRDLRGRICLVSGAEAREPGLEIQLALDVGCF